MTVTTEYGQSHLGVGHLGDHLRPADLRPGHLPRLPGGRHRRPSARPRPSGPISRRPPPAASATASSGNASAAIAGLPAGYGHGWTSSNGDTTPSLTVTLASASTINRIVVDTQSAGSVAPGVRDYTLSVDEPGTGWTHRRH